MHLLKAFWTQEHVTFAGEYFQFDLKADLPRPVQAGLPLLYFGGASREAKRAAAAEADVYLFWGDTVPPERAAGTRRVGGSVPLDRRRARARRLRDRHRGQLRPGGSQATRVHGRRRPRLHPLRLSARPGSGPHRQTYPAAFRADNLPRNVRTSGITRTIFLPQWQCLTALPNAKCHVIMREWRCTPAP